MTITDHYRADRRSGDADAVSRQYRQALNETLAERGITPRLVGRPTLPPNAKAYRATRYAPAWHAIGTADLLVLESAIMAFMRREDA